MLITHSNIRKAVYLTAFLSLMKSLNIVAKPDRFSNDPFVY